MLSRMSEEVQDVKDPRIDLVKGLAILCVLVIHARPLADSAVHEYLINRAVPILLFLFGASSEYWWNSRGDRPWTTITRAWFGMRFARLMFPVWAMLVLWWGLALWLDPAAPLRPHIILATFLGYQPWIGTGWFITLAIELVIVFPLLRLFISYLGVLPTLILALLAAGTSQLFMLNVMATMATLLHNSAPGGQFFYLWIFVPTHLATVTAGIWFARRGQAPGNGALRTWIVVLLAGFALKEWVISEPMQKAAVHALMDVPLALGLTATVLTLVPWSTTRRFLVWCGRNSWGIYLGQLLVHNAVHMAGASPEFGIAEFRWLYVLALFCGGAVFVVTQDSITKKFSRSTASRDSSKNWP